MEDREETEGEVSLDITEREISLIKAQINLRLEKKQY